MNSPKISVDGLIFIAEHEGFSDKPYLCPAGVWTIGFGTTRYPNGSKVSKSDEKISKEIALQYLKHDVFVFEKSVDSFVDKDLTQNQFDALVSFTYNTGSEAFRKSTLLKVINANPNDQRIQKEFMKWVYGGGKKLGGLIKRRQEEANLYFKN